MKKRTKIIIAILVVLFLIVGIFAGVIIYVKNALKPTDDFLEGRICEEGVEACDATVFIVDEGAYGKSTLVKLQENGIIKDADIVYYYNRIFDGYEFVAGYFEIPHKMTDEYGNEHPTTLDELLAFIADPKNAHQDTVTLSFDEGGLLVDYAQKIGEYTTVSAEELLNYWDDRDVIRSYMNEYPFLTEEILEDDVKHCLEGYLFPDTYEFFEFTNCDEITRRFLDRTLEVYQKYKDDFDASKFTINEIFTLASMVQWESGDPTDSSLVAGVFVNRLNAEMMLQSSVTTCYAFDMKEECFEKGDITEINWTYHPYNTYTIDGFPPGPICNANELSIYASLHPDTEDGYFFFVANYCDGGTKFTKTYEEHLYYSDLYAACLN
ncbi:MAG: endolytic transglycosylase MltG [Erysipelotrichaceae bacterium]|nr:endolytic transglycosylase MltG [Erysipelotrichaceae bacterium]